MIDILISHLQADPHDGMLVFSPFAQFLCEMKRLGKVPYPSLMSE